MLSLFTGYGGLSMATESVFGGDLAYVCDVEARDRSGTLVGNSPLILDYRYSTVPNLGDITRVDWSQIGPVDIIDGGSPCQDISVAGKLAGMVVGTRSNLWLAMREVIDILEPTFVIWENVYGALSARADSDLEPCPGCVGVSEFRRLVLRACGRVLGDLASLGFDAAWNCVGASDVGAPHRRRRIFIVAAHPERRARLERRLAIAGETPRWRSLGPAPRRDRALVELLPTPAACNPNDGERVASWLDRRERVKATAINGNGMGTPLSVAVRMLHTPRATRGGSGTENVSLLPTPKSTDSRAHTPSDLARNSPGLRSIDCLLPTPRATDGTKGGPNQAGSSGDLMLPSAVTQLIPTPSTADSTGGHVRRGGRRSDEFLLKGLAQDGRLTRFGQYAAAIHRWEHVVGRLAPDPTVPGRNGRLRLSPIFTEWMMGLPVGWVTKVPELTDNQMLHALGNGVVPQQAIAAIRQCLVLLEMGREVAA